ncbi:clavesin-2-like [Patiria miniata]|uniref:CRAL-TRIO domain-containing protein n=1 Tax=Patiria miniata TaxID=46514 RepID=A0A913ZK14_PATMI|nr:clavesin-2-like [Patiria miniata]
MSYHRTPQTSNLSQETWHKAKHELNEDLSTLDASIQAVRDLVITRPDVRFLRTDNEFIVRFLRAKKFDTFEAFKVLARYFEIRRKKAPLLANISAEDANIREALLGGFPAVLENLDPFGRRIVVFFVANWEEWLFSYLHILQALVLSLEFMLEDEETQVNGFNVIIDWTGVTFKQASNLNPTTMKLTIEIFQDCFPARLGGLHMINQPWYIEGALTVCKPFLKDSTRQKIYLHGNNLSTLHAKIHKEMLPSELGGTNPPYNHFSWAKKLIGCNFKPNLHNTAPVHHGNDQLDDDLKRFSLSSSSKSNVATLEVSSTEQKQAENRPLISLE